MSTTANSDINNAMANIDVLSNVYFEPVDQSDNACFYFPDLAPGEAVILPGQCDDDLPVVRNFEADKVRNLVPVIIYDPIGNYLT